MSERQAGAQDAASGGRGICVMGRTAFGTGIGHHTQSLMELLARKYDVFLWDLHMQNRSAGVVRLPTGRDVLLTDRLDGYAVYIYADVIWNGSAFTKYVAPPRSGYRIAYLAFDSDELPPEWVEILNRDFNAVFFTSSHLIDVAVASGVRIEIGVLPLGLDVAAQVARKYRPSAGRRVRFGTISAYHRRKGLEELVAAFLAEFGDSSQAELVIHSNLAVGDTAASVRSMVGVSGATNILLSSEDLAESAKNELLDTFDVYVNASVGEGYSVGPREALALGKCAVLSDLGAHGPLIGAPGVFGIDTLHDIPAIYPEIDNRQFGFQRAIDASSLRSGLRAAFDYVSGGEAVDTANARKLLGAQFSLESLERSYWALVDPDSVMLRRSGSVSPHTKIPAGHSTAIRHLTGRHGAKLGATKLVVPARDAGFFSLFNTYVSHLAWSLHDSPQRLVLPGWEAGRMLERLHPGRPVSYCYSRPGQGNLWNYLFAPPYDVSAADLDDEEFLYEAAEEPYPAHNEFREPLLTYVHAYQLYRSPQFPRIRRQYASVIRDHVRLLPALQAEIDGFLDRHRRDRFLVAAHVKHPSHALEQPDGTMAGRERYVDLIRQVLDERGIPEASDDWAVFLATEQERVAALFTQEFGDHVIQFSDVERIPLERDLKFDKLAPEEKASEGHQLQHIMAADTERWSPRLAWEVIRDTHVMASADVLLHEVSNVATAASFISPDVEMRFVEG